MVPALKELIGKMCAVQNSCISGYLIKSHVDILIKISCMSLISSAQEPHEAGSYILASILDGANIFIIAESFVEQL